MSEQNNGGRRLGVLRVSRQLLVEALGLPPNTSVEVVQMAIDEPEMVLLRVEQGDLPHIAPGGIIPQVTAELMTEAVEGQAYRARFVRWVV